MEGACSCHCEWLNRVITVDKEGRKITIQNVSETHVPGGIFGLELHGKIQVLSSVFDRCLTCGVVLDCYTGLRSPHLLVVAHTPQHRDLVVHKLLACGPNGSFEQCGLQFAVKGPDLPSCDDCYHLLDGPSVVWNQGRSVHLVHGENLEQDSVDLLTITHNLNLERIENMWCVPGNDRNGHPTPLLLVQLRLKEKRDFGYFDFLCLQVQLQDDKLRGSLGTKIKRVPDAIPLEYGCIAMCVTCHTEESSGAMLEGVVFLVGTKYQQVVLCENGRVTHVIPLQDIPRHVVAIKVSIESLISTCMWWIKGKCHTVITK